MHHVQIQHEQNVRLLYVVKGKAVPLGARRVPEVKVPRFRDNGTEWW